MANLIEKHKFVFVDIASNHNKYYTIELYDNNDVVSLWGRVGYSAGSQSKTYPSQGKYFMEKKIREKTDKGYKEIDTIDKVEDTSNTRISSVSRSSPDLSKIAKAQIKFSSPIVEKLVEYLIKTNAHNIYSATAGKVIFDESAGTFKTPCGIITQTTIDEARTLLTEIGNFVQNKNWDGRKQIELVEKYMTYVPMNIGMKKFNVQSIFPDQQSVINQNSILDSLSASFDAVSKAPVSADKKETKEVELPKLFDVSIELVDDKSEIKRINDFFRSTKHNGHVSSYLRMKNVYAICINHMKKAFETSGKQMGNVWELFHGTKHSNLISIFRHGLKISPPVSAYITGKMFGNGIYFSDQSTKSLNYSYGYWSGKKDTNCFMLLNDVAMGKYYVPSHSTSSHPPTGYHSYFAKAHQSGVVNNEMIVFAEYQVNPRFLLEFEE